MSSDEERPDNVKVIFMLMRDRSPKGLLYCCNLISKLRHDSGSYLAARRAVCPTHFFVLQTRHLIRFRWCFSIFFRYFGRCAGKRGCFETQFHRCTTSFRIILAGRHKIQGFHYKEIIFNGEFNSEDHRYNVFFEISAFLFMVKQDILTVCFGMGNSQYHHWVPSSASNSYGKLIE